MSRKSQKCSSKNSVEIECEWFCMPIKGQAKPQRREPAGSSTRTIPNGERTWTDIESQDYSLTDYSVSKKLIDLLRHGDLPREDDGAIEFWRIKDCLRYEFENSRHWSDEMWKRRMAGGGRQQEKISVLY